TVTVLKAVTEPSPVRRTGISPCRTATAATGTPWVTGLTAGSTAVSDVPSSQYPPLPKTASTNSKNHQRVLALVPEPPCSRAWRRSAVFGSNVVGVSPFIFISPQQDLSRKVQVPE